ncbi:hypothetical protein [Thermomonospora cellulosilytica]|uniref:Sulfotransferase family protein n=1 Tax=Thermomonospora cellulosilytica TaxID=1411118 RepID=A0A7W3MWH7_9ACTN|nr:hypothetical protein [Thermomonospora cellulosilytica]MBA9003192.1 hypothetical protein [Thermomonospora cellulosilytica]
MPADSPPAASSRPPVVYLHIGAPKSGTTFVQDVLWTNAALLRDHGVLLPGGSFAAHVAGTKDLRELEPEPSEPARWDGAWDALAAEIKAAEGARTAVISNEVLCATEQHQVDRAMKSLAPAEVHIVYSARDMAGLLPSEWQEYVKHRYHYSFGHWLTEVIDKGPGHGAGDWFWRVHDIPQVLGRWAAHVPPERIHVLTMPRPGAPHDLLWRRFAELLGIGHVPVDLTRTRTNSSLGAVETEVLRHVNAALDDETPMWLYHRVVTDILALQVLPGSGPRRDRVTLPADRRPWAEQRAAELVEAIRTAGYDVVGSLEELLPPATTAQGVTVPEHLAGSELVETAANAIIGLLDRIAALREENHRLHDERREQRDTPLPKLLARTASERHKTVWRMRVAYWHLMERIKGIEPAAETPGPEDAAEPPTLRRKSNGEQERRDGAPR